MIVKALDANRKTRELIDNDYSKESLDNCYNEMVNMVNDSIDNAIDNRRFETCVNFSLIKYVDVFSSGLIYKLMKELKNKGYKAKIKHCSFVINISWKKAHA